MARQRLGPEDWVLAGQVLLRSGGVPAVKLSALTERLGVTSGSFYHHFRDFPGYLDALADDYGSGNVDRVLAILAEEADPRRRLYLLQDLAEEWDIRELDVAMRVWAFTSDRARASVERLDRAFLALAGDVLMEMGFTREQARLRAAIAYAAGVGRHLVYAPKAFRKGDAEQALDFLTRDAPNP